MKISEVQFHTKMSSLLRNNNQSSARISFKFQW